MLQLWKAESFGRELSRTQEVQPLWWKSRLASFCWKNYPEKKLAAKLKAKRSPYQAWRKRQRRSKGGRKTKGRGRRKKFRNVEGEEEDEKQDEDYEGESDVEHSESEGEDQSESVNQINQMTMCVRGKPVTMAALSSRVSSTA